MTEGTDAKDMKGTMAVRLGDTKSKLTMIAACLGRAPSDLVKDAVEEHLEALCKDRPELEQVLRAVEKVRAGV